VNGDLDISDLNGDEYEAALDRFYAARREAAEFDIDITQTPPPEPGLLRGMVHRRWMRANGPQPWRGIERATGETTKVYPSERRIARAALIEPLWRFRP
jgi:hypothetical protein